MECNNWYFHYQTKKECEDAMEMDKINFPVATTEETEITTDQAGINEEITTVDSTWTNFVSEDADLVTEFDIADETALAPYQPSPTSMEIASNEKKKTEDILNVQIETPNIQIQFKRRRGVDGEVMTIVVVSEIGAIAFVTMILYYGIKFFGNWWNFGENYNFRQAERSHLPLHQYQAENPEETIRPRIQEEDGSDEGSDTPVGYSTAIENTQLTNTTRLDFSPIGPFPDRTVSMSGLDTDHRTGKMDRRSHSGPIQLNLDAEIEDQVQDMDASQLLQQSPLPTVDVIVHNQQPDSDGSETGRRYPVRIRKSPERYGNPVQ